MNEETTTTAPKPESDQKAKWVKPRLNTIEAGSAEIGDTLVPDGGPQKS